MASENILLAVTVTCDKTHRVLKLFKDTTEIIDVYKDLHPGHDLHKAECQSITGEWSVMDTNMMGLPIQQLAGYRTYRFTCKVPEPTDDTSSSSNVKQDALALLMKNAAKPHMRKRKLPPPRCLAGSENSGPYVDLRKNLTQKDHLYNDVLKILGSFNAGFLAEEEGCYIAQVLTNALWYLTNHHHTIEEASQHAKGVIPIPSAFDGLQGYNDTKRKKIKEQQMSAREMKSHSDILLSLCHRPSMQVEENNELKNNVQKLAECVDAYQQYLEIKAAKAKEVHSSAAPVRQVESDIFVSERVGTQEVKPEYCLLNQAMCEIEEWTPLLFDEYVHLQMPFNTAIERYRFLERMQLQSPISILKYVPGGSKTSVVYLWKNEPGCSLDTTMTKTARITALLKPKLPECHTRFMKQEFKQRYANIAHVGPSMESVYRELTGDASASNRLMQQRIQLALSGEPELIVDLRHCNPGRPNDRYNVFWDKMEGVINEVTAADERRHGVAHLAKWISLEDLINEVKSICPEDTPIPSKSCVRLQFTPRNPYTHRALQFTQRFNIQYKIQVRQLRASHPDAHFCAAIFKYFRQHIIDHSDRSIVFCQDDKAKIPVGEPGAPVQTGVRGRSSIVPTTSTLSALDHDVSSKSSITSSVILQANIPEKVEDSWYRGKVRVYVDEAVFGQASAYKAVAMLIQAAMTSGAKVLYRYTDGGSENRNNLIKVQLALIAAFHILNLDMLVAARCAPGQSWQNPAERVMAILNIALQNTATERSRCSEETEKKIKNCGSMAAIREKIGSDEELKDEWRNCMQPVTQTMIERYSRLSLKGEKFSVNPRITPALVEEVTDVITKKFPGINPLAVQKSEALKNAALVEFMKTHCRERTYCFQVAKCDDPACCTKTTPDLQWLPDPVLDPSGEHYLPFSSVLGTATTDGERPSSKAAHKTKSTTGHATAAAVNYFMLDEMEQQKKETSLFTTQNARGLVDCLECDKSRVWYSKNALSSRQQIDVATALSEYEYTCGSPILPPDHSQAKKVQVRLSLNCGDLMEIAYYKLGRSDACGYCGRFGAETDSDLKKQFKCVLPLCSACKDSGKKPACSRPFLRGCAKK